MSCLVITIKRQGESLASELVADAGYSLWRRKKSNNSITLSGWRIFKTRLFNGILLCEKIVLPDVQKEKKISPTHAYNRDIVLERECKTNSSKRNPLEDSAPGNQREKRQGQALGRFWRRVLVGLSSWRSHPDSTWRKIIISISTN